MLNTYEELSERFTEKLREFSWINEGRIIVDRGASGNEFYFTGSMLRRILVLMLHGIEKGDPESGFLVLGGYIGRSGMFGWFYEGAKKGVHIYSKGEHALKVLPAGVFKNRVTGVIPRNLEEYFGTVNFRHQAVVYDFVTSSLLGPGVEAIQNQALMFNNLSSFERARLKWQNRIDQLIAREEAKTGFRYVEGDKV